MHSLLRDRCLIRYLVVCLSIILSSSLILVPCVYSSNTICNNGDIINPSVINRQDDDIFAPDGFSSEGQRSARVCAREGYSKFPLCFIKNEGQIDERVKYYEMGGGHRVFFAKDGVYLSLRQRNEANKKNVKKTTPADSLHEFIRLFPLGADRESEIAAEDLQKGVINYFVGSSEQWRSNIPTYGTVVYKGIYNGVDMRFYGNNRRLEYDVIVQPGASPSRVQLCYEGIDDLRLRKDGDLEIVLEEGSIVQKKPYIYQMIGGEKVEIQGEFRILKAGDGRRKPVGQGYYYAARPQQFIYGFKVASYDQRRPIVIDPTLEYSTYLGGGGEDYGYGIAVDGSGSAYVTGYTASSDFPKESAYQATLDGGIDAFVSKFDASGNLVYSTYLGGSNGDAGSGIAVDNSGSAYINGVTTSNNFPTTPSAYQKALSGWQDAFVSKLDASGDLVYSTYLGGNGGEEGSGIAVDSSGSAYVTGFTSSNNFPTTPSAHQGVFGGGNDAFMSRFDSSGNLVYSTYLGGGDADRGNSIAVDGSGSAYVAGTTFSNNFPTTPYAYQTIFLGGYSDVFVARFNSSGNLTYSTYLGGTADEKGSGIAVDSSGSAYVTGFTFSYNFPTTPSAYQKTLSTYGYRDIFVARFNSWGNLVYSTYLGGNDNDWGSGIAVDSSGSAYVTGFTFSYNFPTTPSAYQKTISAGGLDAFVVRFDPSGDLTYSTYLGGSGGDWGVGVAMDDLESAYVTGYTASNDFPMKSAYQGVFGNGNYDAFVTKLSLLPPPVPTQTPSPTPEVSPTGEVTPTPQPTPLCEVAYVIALPRPLIIQKGNSATEKVTLICTNGDLAAGVEVTATVKPGGKKFANVSPPGATTDDKGQVTFTITATDKTGNAKIEFKSGSEASTVPVKVKKK